MKYREWLNEWLENYIRPSVKNRTYERYGQLIRIHIEIYIGDYELLELNAMVLQRHITILLNSGNVKTKMGLSPSTVNSVVSVMKNSLRVANVMNLIPTDYTSKLSKPKVIEKRVECFTFEEQKK